jgi:hypothetical protein
MMALAYFAALTGLGCCGTLGLRLAHRVGLRNPQPEED